MKALRIAVITLYTFVGVLPLLWLVLTAFKHHPDTITASAKFIPIPGVAPGGEGLSFAPTIEAFAHLAETLGRPMVGALVALLEKGRVTALQDEPHRLPALLRDENPGGRAWRLVDGEWTRGDVRAPG